MVGSYFSIGIGRRTVTIHTREADTIEGLDRCRHSKYTQRAEGPLHYRVWTVYVIVERYVWILILFSARSPIGAYRDRLYVAHRGRYIIPVRLSRDNTVGCGGAHCCYACHATGR